MSGKIKSTIFNLLGIDNGTIHKVYSKLEYKHLTKDFLLIILGVVSAGFGLKGFLLPNNFIDGGITGVSLIINSLSTVSLSVLLVLINIPFLLIGYKTIGKGFAVKSIIAILLLAIAVHFLPSPIITHDKLLVAIFGGFFLGLGIGLSVRGGAVLDGTEILAVYLNKKSPFTVGDIILGFNIIIFSFAAYVFSVEIAMYAILTYFSASKTVDFLIDGIEEYIGVTIISNNPEEIRLMVIEKLGRGCTLYSGKRGYAPRGEILKETDIVYTVVTRLEISKLLVEIEKTDREAFVIMNAIKDAKGGMIKKRRLK